MTSINRNAMDHKKENSQNELNQLKREFSMKMADMERIYSQQIDSERNLILNSWRWRIGNFQVKAILGIGHYLMTPLRFFRGMKLLFRMPIARRRNSENTTSYGNPHSCQSAEVVQKTTMACIFDTFTASCFEPEFNILSPTPDNWKRLLKQRSFEALFCESAWRGNNATWRFYLGNLKDIKKKGLKEIVTFCQKNDIPTIFWNKEDPVHFTHFIEDARQFDYIFTTDESMIPIYREHVNHNRIYSLPFAAQIKLHNPVLTSPRDEQVCFAGSYYTTQHAERMYDLELLLKPALHYGLHIYDRNFNSSGTDRIKYQFPKVYQPYIRGKLEYPEMVAAYKRFKVFLNVNSVKYSSTMCARRVFELLACGTPVISTYSTALTELLGEDTVLITESEHQTRIHLERLLHDEAFWWKQSLMGIRRVMERHTYGHRADYILQKIGKMPIASSELVFLAIVKVCSISAISALQRMLSWQEYRNFKVLLRVDTEMIQKKELTDMLSNFHSESLNIIGIADSDPEYVKCIRDIQFTHGAYFNPNNYYGKNYLSDFALAIRYSKSCILGKKAIFESQPDESIEYVNKGFEFSYVDFVFSDTIVVEKSLILQMPLLENLRDDFLEKSNLNILSIDPYNFLRRGYNAYCKNPDYISSIISV